MTWHQIMGHKGPVLRPRCIGTERVQTQLLLNTLHPDPGGGGFRIKPEIEDSVENKSRPSRKLNPELLETAMANIALIQTTKTKAI
jgi:hypothetical protein